MSKMTRIMALILVAVMVLALLACSTVWLLNGSFQSFVYFQF